MYFLLFPIKRSSHYLHVLYNMVLAICPQLWVQAARPAGIATMLIEYPYLFLNDCIHNRTKEQPN